MVNFCNFVIASCPRGQTATTFTLCPSLPSLLSLSSFSRYNPPLVSAFLSPTHLVPFRFNDDRAHQGYSPLPFPFLTHSLAMAVTLLEQSLILVVRIKVHVIFYIRERLYRKYLFERFGIFINGQLS